MDGLLKGNALVIGINEYSGGISKLSSAVKDAQAMSEMLREHHHYSVTTLLDEDASTEAIYRCIEQTLPTALDEESAFLLYFAGHGIARGDGSEGPKGFLLPQNASSTDQDTWVSMERIRTAFERYPNRHMLIILDCCFAGTFRWTSSRDVFIQAPLYESQFKRFVKGRAWHVLTSASHDEKALDVAPGKENTRGAANSNGHSPFASAILDGLSGAADSAQGTFEPDGVITATELYQYAFNVLVPLNAKSHQTPGIWPLRPDNEGQFVFKNPKCTKNTIPDPPLDDTHNPWFGLNAYGMQDNALFFGRDDVVEDIIEHLENNQTDDFVAVVGASGTGKSSVVRAGVIPQLNDKGWKTIVADRLTAQPQNSLKKVISELKTKLSKEEKSDAKAHTKNSVKSETEAESKAHYKHTVQSDEADSIVNLELEQDNDNDNDNDNIKQRTVIYFDQFEELFTLCLDRALQQRFLGELRSLIDSDPQLYVIVTLRSDFEPRFAASAAFDDIWQKCRFLIPAFTSDNYRQCIEEPARVKALYFEDDELISTIIEDVMAMPGGLPLLSFSLTEMYRVAQQRRRDTLSNDRALMRVDYESIGGVIGALHQRASSLYNDAEKAVQNTIQRVFLRMVAQDGARIARRRIKLIELDVSDPDEQARIKKVVDIFVNARLLVVDQNTIEPAHDSLLVAWSMLLDWLSENGSQELIRAIWRSAEDWQKNERSKGLTWYDDPRLPLALESLKQKKLNTLETQFITASNKQKTYLTRRNWIGSLTILVALFAGSVFVIQEQSAAEIARLNAIESDQIAERAKIAENEARNARDNTFLDILQRGNFFNIKDMLGNDSQGGLINVSADWRPLVTVPQGVFVAGSVYQRGRVLAAGHENLLTYTDEDGQSLFLDLALDWLIGDDSLNIYFTQENSEALQVYHPQDLLDLKFRLFQKGFRVIHDQTPFTDAINQASVVIIANAWQSFSQDQVSAIELHVASGGGLIVTGLGWSWIDFGPHGLNDRQQAIDTYPMNLLMKKYGLTWDREPLWLN